MILANSVEVFIVKQNRGSRDNETANAQPKLHCDSFSFLSARMCVHDTWVALGWSALYESKLGKKETNVKCIVKWNKGMFILQLIFGKILLLLGLILALALALLGLGLLLFLSCLLTVAVVLLLLAGVCSHPLVHAVKDALELAQP